RWGHSRPPKKCMTLSLGMKCGDSSTMFSLRPAEAGSLRGGPSAVTPVQPTRPFFSLDLFAAPGSKATSDAPDPNKPIDPVTPQPPTEPVDPPDGGSGGGDNPDGGQGGS